MRTPIKPPPEAVVAWTARARWLRWLDAAGAALALLGIAAWLAPGTDVTALAALAALATALGAAVPPLRRRWRPVSACVGLVVSEPLRPGDRAWHIRRDGAAQLVLVTARRGVRLVVAEPAGGPAEGVAVRRTRVLLVPAGVGKARGSQ